MNPSYRVAVVGATGLVGETMVRVLEERRFPLAELRLFASERSENRHVRFHGDTLRVERLEPKVLRNLDIVLFATEAPLSREYAPQAVAAGAYAIDNSSAFRLDPGVPLVVPEVNPERLPHTPAIIANPNCSTIQLVVALKPLHDQFGLRRVVVSTYQAVSGAGREGLHQFDAERRGEKSVAGPFSHPIVDNCLPEIGSFDEGGHTTEEMKLINETRKILNLPDLPVAATAVRVPVQNSHSEAVWLQLGGAPEITEIRDVLSEAPGLVVVDEPTQHRFPLAAQASGRDEVLVGRIRRDPSSVGAYWLWVVADNLRKGAATNAVQIAEALANRPATSA
jgi:aspartate-semialdehyde dehydrogenase